MVKQNLGKQKALLEIKLVVIRELVALLIDESNNVNQNHHDVKNHTHQIKLGVSFTKEG